MVAVFTPRPFDPIDARSPAMDSPCPVCHALLLAGEIPTLLPKSGAMADGLTVEASPAHWRCRPGVSFVCVACDSAPTHRPYCRCRPCGDFVPSAPPDGACAACHHTEHACRAAGVA